MTNIFDGKVCIAEKFYKICTPVQQILKGLKRGLRNICGPINFH